MKRLIKKHIVFMSIIAASALIVLVLLVFVMMANTKMAEAAKNLQNQKDAIQRLNSAQPSPAAENLELLEKDAERYRERLDRLHQYFGRPYERAYVAFCNELGVPADVFRELFRNFWEGNRETIMREDLIIDLFIQSGGKLAGAPEAEAVEGETADIEATEDADSDVVRNPRYSWTKESWNRAMRAFIDEASKYTLEDLGDVESKSAKELLMFSLGVPRSFGGDTRRAAAYISSTKTKLIEKFTNVGLSGTAQNFSFSIVGTGEPSRSMIVPIVKVWDIVCDLGARIADSNVNSLEAFQVHSLEPFTGMDGYAIYRFYIEVSGSLDDIRDFTTHLADAYVDSRVYIVRRMAIMKDFDGAQMLIEETINPVTTIGDGRQQAAPRVPAGGMMMPGMMGGMGMMTPSALSSRMGRMEDIPALAYPHIHEGRALIRDLMKVDESEDGIIPSLRKNYGRPIIGLGTGCTAALVIDYAVYITDELETI